MKEKPKYYAYILKSKTHHAIAPNRHSPSIRFRLYGVEPYLVGGVSDKHIYQTEHLNSG